MSIEMSIELPEDLSERTPLPGLNAALDETQIVEEEIDRYAFDLRLSGFGEAGSTAGAVRVDKIRKMRAALAAGTYSVPPELVATKMLDVMLAVERKRVQVDRRRKPRVGHRRLMRGRARRENG